MEVFIVTPSGEKHVVEMGPTWLGVDVKREVAKLTGMVTSSFDVQYEGNIVEVDDNPVKLGAGMGDQMEVVLNKKEEAKRVLDEMGMTHEEVMREVFETDNPELLDICVKAGNVTHYQIPLTNTVVRASSVTEYLLAQPGAEYWVTKNAKSSLMCCVSVENATLFKRFLLLGAGKRRKHIPSVSCVANISCPVALLAFIEYYMDKKLTGETPDEILQIVAQRVLRKPALCGVVPSLAKKIKAFPAEAFITSVNHCRWDWADAIIQHCTAPSATHANVTQLTNFTDRCMGYLEALLDRAPVKDQHAAFLAASMLRKTEGTPQVFRKLLRNGVPPRVSEKIHNAEILSAALDVSGERERREVFLSAVICMNKHPRGREEVVRMMADDRFQRYFTEEVLLRLTRFASQYGAEDMVEHLIAKQSKLHETNNSPSEAQPSCG